MIARLGLAATALVLSACINFTSQTMTFRYDEQADRLYIFQVYEGIHGDDGAAELTEGEIRELRSVADGERTFFFDNWTTTYDRAEVEITFKRVAAYDELTPYRERGQAFRRLLLENVHVENGEFYLNPQDQLSGYQFVTVDRFSKVLRAGNRVIPRLGGGGDVSDESKALFEAAAAADFEWIEVAGNQLSLTLPVTYADYLKERRRLAVDSRKRMASRTADTSTIRQSLDLHIALVENDFQLLYADNAATIKLGYPQSPFTSVYIRLPGEYKPNAVAHAARHYRKAEPTHIGALIAQLGADDFAQREQADAVLRSQGAWARPQLEAAKTHDDPEIRLHARTILQAARPPGPPSAERNALPANIETLMRTFLQGGR